MIEFNVENYNSLYSDPKEQDGVNIPPLSSDPLLLSQLAQPLQHLKPGEGVVEYDKTHVIGSPVVRGGNVNKA